MHLFNLLSSSREVYDLDQLIRCETRQRQGLQNFCATTDMFFAHQALTSSIVAWEVLKGI